MSRVQSISRYSLPLRLRCAITAQCVAWGILTSGGACLYAQDQAVVLDSQQREVIRSGEILDHNAEQLIIQTPQGRKIEIPNERVIRLLPQKNADHSLADKRFEERSYRAALDAYQKAMRSEKRHWLRRQVLAQIVRCHRNRGNYQLAGSMFLILHREDPQTLHFGCIPLTWRPWQPDRQVIAEATKWLGDPRPTARLIAASWLLSTSQRPESIRVLERLKRDSDSRVQQLANAQLWQTQLVTTRKDIVLNRWPRALESMPFELRGGPHFVLGRALAKHGELDRSVLEFMRVPIAYGDMYDLSAESLWRSGQLLEKSGSDSEAIRLYGEIIRDFPETAAASQAQQRIESIEARG